MTALRPVTLARMRGDRGKITLAAAILGYLLVQVQRQAGFARLVHEPKDWHLLAIGLLCTLGARSRSPSCAGTCCLTALGLDFRLRDTMRLGALGFALNFVSLGSIGGDLFKAIFAAKDSPGRRTEAVATVVVDRLVGVLMMLTLASVATFFVDWTRRTVADQGAGADRFAWRPSACWSAWR